LNPLEFIQLTPKTNCGECGHPTCLAFAVAVTKGGADPARCPYVALEGLPDEFSQAGGDGLQQVDRGQDERDMALVAYLKSKIREVDFGAVANRLGVAWKSDQPEIIKFGYLGREVVLSRDEVRMEGGELVDPRDQILLYNYVSSGGGEAPRGDWVGMESLPNSISKVRTLAAYCEQPLAKRFSGRLARLVSACQRIGALSAPAEQSGDFEAVIPVLPQVPIYVLFWDEDAEDGFESRVKVLFDRHVLDFLDIESLVFAAERMAERIMELDT